MAFCPECGGEIDAMETLCPHCDYDFPNRSLETRRAERGELAYSFAADLPIGAWIVLIVIGLFGTLAAAVAILFEGVFSKHSSKRRWPCSCSLVCLSFFFACGHEEIMTEARQPAWWENTWKWLLGFAAVVFRCVAGPAAVLRQADDGPGVLQKEPTDRHRGVVSLRGGARSVAASVHSR